MIPGDIPDGWASIIVAAITVLGGTAVVQIVNIVNTRKNRSAIQDMDTKVNAIRDHTVNSHTDRNMRVEMDERYEVQTRLLEDIVTAQQATRDDIGGIRQELRQERQERHAVSERVQSVSDRVTELEK